MVDGLLNTTAGYHKKTGRGLGAGPAGTCPLFSLSGCVCVTTAHFAPASAAVFCFEPDDDPNQKLRI